jgi:hypothetical protein
MQIVFRSLRRSLTLALLVGSRRGPARAVLSRVRGETCAEHAAPLAKKRGAGRSGGSGAIGPGGATRNEGSRESLCGRATATAGAAFYRRAQPTFSPRMRDSAARDSAARAASGTGARWFCFS